MTPKRSFLGAFKGWPPRWFSAGRRRRNRRGWDKRWEREDFARPWLRRGVSKETITAVEELWFPPGSKVIDLGCGEGDLAAWLAEQGFDVLGVDIAPAAIERAKARFGEVIGRLEFQVHDLCISPPPGGPYRVLVDRGCFHQISLQDLGVYGRHLLQAATPDALLLLFHKAYRNGTSPGDPAERQRVTQRIQEGLGGGFLIEKCDETFLDPFHGLDPEHALPGLVFWMRRLQPASFVQLASPAQWRAV